MAKCPAIHEHQEFSKSYNSRNKKEVYETTKLKRFLKSEDGDRVGEYLKGDLAPFKSFPRGNTETRCLFILCKDCNKKLLSTKCEFCNTAIHTMNDAVLFYITSEHDETYKKGKKIVVSYLKVK